VDVELERDLAEDEDEQLFESFFAMEYAVTGGTTEDVDEAADGLVISYNRLITEFEDPLGLRILRSRVRSATLLDLEEDDRRVLQNGSSLDIVFSIISVIGSCGITCPRDTKLTNQVTGTRRLGKDSSEDMLRPGVPTEEELLEDYSGVITAGDFRSIADVVGLDELDDPPTQSPTLSPTQSPTEYPTLKSKRSGKKPKDSKNGKGKGKGGSGKKSKSSKSGKGKGKGSGGEEYKE